MNARAWCLVGIRALGLIVLLFALPAFLSSLWNTLQNVIFETRGWSGPLPFLGMLSETGFMVLGLYLFFGGKWAARQITRGIPVPGACPGCGYDVRDIQGTRCPECGAKLHR